MLPRSHYARRWVAGCWLFLAVGGCAGNEEPLRDAWALWLEYGPVCDESRRGESDPSLNPRWRRALASLNAETQVVMEELLSEARAERSETGRLLSRLTAASRALCELTGAEILQRATAAAAGAEGVAASPSLRRARAEVARVRSRLAVAMPLSEDEVWRRAARYSNRLSAAVSTALEAAGRGGDPEAERASVDRVGDASTEGAASSGRASAGSTPGRSSVAAPAGEAAPRARVRDRAAAPIEPVAGPEAISIRPTSGQSWAEIRRLRGERAARRLAEWRPLYRDELRPVLDVRRQLARQLEGESLEALAEPCRRLGRAAERVPASVVASAPAADLGSDLAALLAAYAEAGKACAAGRPVLAWARLSAGDRHWAAAVATLERLRREPSLPPSLRGRAVDGPGAGGRRVE